MRSVTALVVGCVLVGCSSSGPATDDPLPDSVVDVTSPDTSAPVTTTTMATRPVVPLAPPSVTVVRVTGPEEVVFDWTSDRCEDAHIPDIAARAFRSPDGAVNLTIGHWSTYRMVGPTLDDLVSDCSGPLLTSDYDPDPAAFDDSEWLAAVYTTDGEVYHGIVHNEYRGDTHPTARPGQCPSGERLPCLDTSFTQVVSFDGGRTFDHAAPPPGHLVATLPYTYRDDTVPTGIRQPSNIIDGRDGYWYLFGNVSDHPDAEQWVCAMRTDDLSDPTAWRYWDGWEFSGVWGDPYADPDLADDRRCSPLAEGALGDALNEGVVYDESIDRFVMIGVGTAPVGRGPGWGVYVSTSTDLVEWSTRQFLLEVPVTSTVDDMATDLMYAYPTLIDPDSTSPNFETTDGEMYLYMARFNAGGGSLDRDLVRWPVAIVEEPALVPDWTFDNGRPSGWVQDNDLAPLDVSDGVLSTRSTGGDPWLLSPRLSLPAGDARLILEMRVEGGARVETDGQLFWSVEGDPFHVEDRSVVFPVVADGAWRTYEVDLSAVPSWTGIVTGLRLDPVGSEGRTIEIDRIVLSE